MNTKPSTTDNSFPHDARIDAVLRAYSHAVPTPGLESRVAARLSAISRQSLQSRSASRFLVLRRLSAAALAAAVAMAIVLGTVQHAHHAALPQSVRIPPPGGASTAGSELVPARPVPETPTLDPQAPRASPHGRATTSGTDRRPAGTTVPHSPYPSQHPAASQR